MNKIIIGIDNGVTGSIGVLSNKTKASMLLTPTKKEQNFTKKKQQITRLNSNEFNKILTAYKQQGEVICILERPLINPKLFFATESALRCFEAELITIENLEISHLYIDSKEWQRKLISKGIKGSAELKKASLDIGLRLFPHLKEEITKHKDADGLLIAYWYKHYFDR